MRVGVRFPTWVPTRRAAPAGDGCSGHKVRVLRPVSRPKSAESYEIASHCRMRPAKARDGGTAGRSVLARLGRSMLLVYRVLAVGGVMRARLRLWRLMVSRCRRGLMGLVGRGRV